MSIKWGQDKGREGGKEREKEEGKRKKTKAWAQVGALSGPPQHLAPHLPHINEMAPSLATYIIAQLQTMFHTILQENVTTKRSSHRQKENRSRALFLPRKRLALTPWGQDIGLAKIYCNKLIKSLHCKKRGT